MTLKHILLFPVLCLSISLSYAQPSTGSDTNFVQILKADRLNWRKISNDNELQILAGDVALRQGTTLFYCDSCVLNQNGKLFEAFGNVRIIDKDTSRTSSDYSGRAEKACLAWLQRHSAYF